jgi:peptide/nickel transport system substrate-binding protein
MQPSRWLAVSAMAALALLLAACGGGGQSGGAGGGQAGDLTGGAAQPTAAPAAQIRRGGTLVLAMEQNPQRFDPKLYTDVYSSEIALNIFDTLVKVDDKLTPVPFLAERIEQPDDLTYVFHLRKGVKFHDGTELDAEAVKFSVDRIREERRSPDYSEVQIIVESAVVDKYTYRAKLSEPNAPFLVLMSGRPGIVVSPTAVRTLGEERFALSPVGTGPFKFGEWRTDSLVRVEKNPDYWRMGADNRPLPYVDRVEWRIISEPANRLTALQAGDVDISSVRDQDLPIVKSDSNLQWRQEPGANWGGLVLTLSRPPFDNKALRQALAFAIDREEIVRVVNEGNAEVANSPIPPPHAWARDASFKPYTYDLAKARQKLAEGGRPNGFEFEAWFSAGSSTTQQLAELMQAQLARAGIKMNIQYGDFNGVVIPKARNQESNAYAIAFNCGYGDPDPCVARRFLAGSTFNYMFYDNPRVNEMIVRARQTSNREERARLYKEVVPLIMDDAPFLFTTHGVVRFTGSKKVQGWFLGAKATAGYSEYWKTQ